MVKIVTAEVAMGEVTMAVLEAMEILAAVEVVIHMDHPEVAVEVIKTPGAEEVTVTVTAAEVVMLTMAVMVEVMVTAMEAEVDLEVDVEDLEAVVEVAKEGAMVTVAVEEVKENMVKTKFNQTTKFTPLASQPTSLKKTLQHFLAPLVSSKMTDAQENLKSGFTKIVKLENKKVKLQ